MITTDIIGVIDATAGYHVNTTHPVADWAAFKVTPASPRRVFGGGATHYYTFSDAAEFEAELASADMSIPVAQAIPQAVTRRQARQALLLAGVLGSVQSAIDGIADPVQRGMAQIEWDDSQAFERNRPLLIALGAALGLDSAELDQLFITASGL